MYASPICPSTFTNEKWVCRLPFEERKTASTIKMNERSNAWPSKRAQPSPRARRLAYENGIATPTMNMNDGWIRSQNVQPRHSA